MQQIQDWVSRHKILTGVIVVVCGTVVFKGYKKTKSLRKTRRAKKARNGGRTEVIVIAGSPTLPLTKSLSLDMERRGFIVFVVCNAAEDEELVSSYARPDIKPLSIDTTDVSVLSVPLSQQLDASVLTIILFVSLAPTCWHRDREIRWLSTVTALTVATYET